MEVGGMLFVSPVALTITAVDKSKDYGAALPALTASYSGFVNGDSAASLTTAPTCSRLAAETSHLGSRVVIGSRPADNDYTISYVAGTLTVNPVALTITA